MAKITISRVSFVGKAPVINLTPSFVLRVAEAHARTQDALAMYDNLKELHPVVENFAELVQFACELVEDIYASIAEIDDEEKKSEPAKDMRSSTACRPLAETTI